MNSSVYRPRWQRSAACRGVDSDLFFPERGASTAEAKAVCRTCPVIAECRDFAIANWEPGIWGGLSERERRTIRSSQRRAASKVSA